MGCSSPEERLFSKSIQPEQPKQIISGVVPPRDIVSGARAFYILSEWDWRPAVSAKAALDGLEALVSRINVLCMPHTVDPVFPSSISLTASAVAGFPSFCPFLITSPPAKM